MAKNTSRGGGVHTTPNPNGAGWINQLKGKVTSTHRLKERAIEAGRDLAQERKTEHVIHNLDGSIRQKNSYGKDPSQSKG
ncbi:DUF2188 domain-containing protein [Pyxidicoccus fallax]|uniref:DUF2188 domain-containing protein n=1 Tax=Pyxidicoccus fallax TaxID=394095 RepID=A0A848LXF1_9BACT|nr:DUF2188 domain-containing protein [Pyxidicoccus fallax]NMO21934.1 DUF2188 domain-containing protein [Pyxidicoccus fallax]NPC83505.1 DUF2188 domain-containing protein [Pyxidicoccus fallax]